MGERYQIHIRITADEENFETQLDSIHLQWCWGSHIIRNLNRLLKTLKNTQCEYPSFYNLKKYINGIINVNKGIDGHNYPYGICSEEEPYLTTSGDSNHGWAVIFLHITKKGKCKVLSKFYDVDGKIVSNDELWKDALGELEYYKTSKREIQKYKKLLDKKLFNNTDEDLQGIFNKEVDLFDKKKEEKIKKEGHKLDFVIKEKGKDSYKVHEKVRNKLIEAGFEVDGY